MVDPILRSSTSNHLYTKLNPSLSLYDDLYSQIDASKENCIEVDMH